MAAETDSEEQSPVGWLREQVTADLAAARKAAGSSTPVPLDRATPDFVATNTDLVLHLMRHAPHHAIADCEAKLAILDRCEPLLPDARPFREPIGICFDHLYQRVMLSIRRVVPTRAAMMIELPFCATVGRSKVFESTTAR